MTRIAKGIANRVVFLSKKMEINQTMGDMTSPIFIPLDGLTPPTEERLRADHPPKAYELTDEEYERGLNYFLEQYEGCIRLETCARIMRLGYKNFSDSLREVNVSQMSLQNEMLIEQLRLRKKGLRTAMIEFGE